MLESKKIEIAPYITAALFTQDALNKRLTPDWKTRGFKYYRAVWTEMAEAVMYFNWTWWKGGASLNKPLSPEQRADIVIELVDVLHFGLSMDLIRVNSGQISEAALIPLYSLAFTDAKPLRDDEDVIEAIEGLVVDAIQIRYFNVKKLASIALYFGVDLAGLLCFYFGKSILNEFRWSHGYNEKQYIKIWLLPDGRRVEDNTVLSELLASLISTKNPLAVLSGLVDVGDGFAGSPTLAYRERLMGTFESLYSEQKYPD